MIADAPPMISALVYGRNDGYSYEVNRRTALGLNQLAAQLAPGRDEIVFVDYNTDNDLPTFPETIADTLTARAVGLIRVIRVRPGFHATQPQAGPPVREAVARNIALRRLSPGASWALSTNPDCLLLAEGAPLHQLIDGLAPGYYGLPRHELPRFLWEALPRSDPALAAAEALAAAKALALEEIVRHPDPAIGYDAPGDFQLAPVADLVALAGFDERMTLGWHVDSNMNARLARRHGALRDLNDAAGGALTLFHAEHARRASAKHEAGRAEDPFEQFVENADEIPPGQGTSWGAPDERFEEFPLADPPVRRLIQGLIAGASGEPPADYVYGPESFGALPCGEDLDDHLFAFLFDHLAYLAPDAPLGWFGAGGGRGARFAARARAAGLSNPIRIAGTAAEIAPTLDGAEVLILDADPGAGVIAETAFAALIRAERARMTAGQPPRRVIGLNVPHGPFEAPFLSLIPGAMTPVATRIRFGEVAPFDPAPVDLAARAVATPPGTDGYVAIQGRDRLAPGAWRLDYEVETGLSWKGRVVIDVALNGDAAAHAVVPTGKPGVRRGSIAFESGAATLFHGGVECRLWADGKTRAALISARLVPTGP